MEKKEGDRAIGTLRASLKGWSAQMRVRSGAVLHVQVASHLVSRAASEAEVVRVSEAVTRMTQQLEGERESHTTTTRSLHTVAEEGRTKVSHLSLVSGGIFICMCSCACVCVHIHVCV